jgi:hypothetical protein
LHGYEVAALAILTKALFLEGDLGSLGHVTRYVRREVGTLAKAVSGRRGALSLPVAVARVKGAAVGPFAYVSARRR